MIELKPKTIPAGWVQRTLGGFGVIVGGGTPSRSEMRHWGGSIPWASVKDIRVDDVFLDDTAEHITPDAISGSAATLVPTNTPVICTRMAVGRCALTSQSTAINQDLKAFLLESNTDARFFIRLLQFSGPLLDHISVGSTVRGITLGDLLSHEVLAPTDISEQSCIAAVLDATDEASAKTKAVIAKLKQIRTGLLHDLLTRGLDENGELRDPIAHPEQFKDSPLGPIPEKWTCCKLGEVLSAPPRNGYSPQEAPAFNGRFMLLKFPVFNPSFRV
jgi:type I restriction enzyme, S subunit